MRAPARINPLLHPNVEIMIAIAIKIIPVGPKATFMASVATVLGGTRRAGNVFSGNVTTYYISGQVPPPVNKDADPASPQAYGDVTTQTVGVLNRIKGILEGFGLGMGDVVKMQVFLVHDARAPMDFKAFMEGYTQFFGGAQPNLPARAVVQVAGLSNPGWLVEIEVVAAKK